MTLEEIERSQVNLDIAREAFDQASKRLADMLDTKKAFEQKAFTLFNGYLTLSLPCSVWPRRFIRTTAYRLRSSRL